MTTDRHCTICVCRALFCRGDDDNDTITTIRLDNLAEQFAWVQLIGQDMTTMQTADLRNDIYLDDLLLALGENLDDIEGNGTTATLRLVPGIRLCLPIDLSLIVSHTHLPISLCYHVPVADTI